MSEKSNDDRHQVYTTVVIGGAFVGMFTAWESTRAQLSDISNVLVALSVLISLAAFVLFEVLKVWRVTNSLPLDTRGFQRYWRITFGVTVIFGLAATVIMISSFLIVLLGPAHPKNDASRMLPPKISTGIGTND